MRFFSVRKVAVLIACICFFIFILPHINKHGKGTSSRIHDNHYVEDKVKKSVKKDLGEESLIDNQEDKKTYLDTSKLGNYETVVEKKTGPGEDGTPVVLEDSESNRAQQSIHDYGFNMVASDKISMTRTIPDTRLDECRYWQYPSKLPKTSVILVFHNEGWSTLVRTVHSIVNMTPADILEEVVMVDDKSNKEHLGSRLDEYMRKEFGSLVKIFRNSERLGLIKTRTAGAKFSTGEVIVFLDAHCECNRNWLPPLLARIVADKHVMTVPVIDGINWDNMAYRRVYQSDKHFRGIFEWGFLYKESEVPERELKSRNHNSEPYRLRRWVFGSSPTHAGGLFAINREYFLEMGAYDSGLLIWGGENFELSFKIWQCGGSIEWVPCSKVGHIYRNHMPYSFGDIKSKVPIIQVNYMRVVEVWLEDKYKDYFYTREPQIRGFDYGDISTQLAYKQSHNCKSFDWFMKNVAYEVYEKFPPPPKNLFWGELTDVNGKCLDTRGSQPGAGPAGISGCHHYGGNQFLRLDASGQLNIGERCLVTSGEKINVGYCIINDNGPWSYDKDSGLLENSILRKCLGHGDESDSLKFVKCDRHSNDQKWTWNELRSWK